MCYGCGGCCSLQWVSDMADMLSGIMWYTPLLTGIGGGCSVASGGIAWCSVDVMVCSVERII